MLTDYTLGIKNYKPFFLDTTHELVNQNITLLNSLIGKNILEVYTVWSLEYNKEWTDSPIVLKLNDIQLELCAFKFDEFSLTVNTIDLSSDVNWHGDNKFKWKTYKEYDDFRINDIAIIELKNEISNFSENPGFINNWWGLGGIQFIGESHQLSIYNGFDCNIISHEINLGPGIRTKAIDDCR